VSWRAPHAGSRSRPLSALLALGLAGVACGSASTGVPGGAGPSPSPSSSGSGAYFPAGSSWTTTVTTAAVDAQSAEIIAWLDRRGWGSGRFQIDFSLDVLHADAATPLRPFEPTGDFFAPDCDRVAVPVPDGGNVEGEQGYACEQDGDCHLLVVDDSRRQLFEMWRADIRGAQFRGGCLAVWNLNRVYGPSGRGLQCTSADAAGYPISALLFTADEVAAGSIAHAIRFILPNSSIRRGEIVAPATHGTSATSGPRSAPPYGARLRLRRDYPLQSLPNEAARVVARALQGYGMFLADGGQVPLTAQSDRHTRTKWDGLLGSRDLAAIRPADFEVLQMQTPLPLSDVCVREPF
jgi:serine/threonine-protein kinase